MFIHDKYVLKESDIFQIKQQEEITINLDLVKVAPMVHTLLVGKVLYRCMPIKDATVMVFDNDGSIRYRTTTDAHGIYRCRSVLEPGMYNVIVTAAGYDTLMKTVMVRNHNITYLTFQLNQSSMYRLGIVYGDIVEAESRKPIDDAIVYLKSEGVSNEMVYKTRSNHSGHYQIYDISPNYYEIIIEKHGYQQSNPREIKIDTFGRVRCDVVLLKESIEC